MRAMDDAAVRSICELFDLGVARRPPEPVAGGLTNRMWRLETERGAFAVKEMNRDFGRADYVAWFDRAFTLERAAYDSGVPMPRPVPVAASGRCLGELPGTGDRPTTVRVHEWVDGVKLDNSVSYPPDAVARVAGILARIHALRMTSDAAAGDALPVFGDAHWRDQAERLERGRVEWAPRFRALLPVLDELESYLIAAHGDPTPLLLSHRDSDAKNLVRAPSGALLLVDWDEAGPVNPRHDLANEALVWAGVHRGDPVPAIARAFVAAYRREGGADGRFRATDLAELVSVRLAWFDFNVRRVLGERARDELDRANGEAVVRRNFSRLPLFARSLERWVDVLGD